MPKQVNMLIYTTSIAFHCECVGFLHNNSMWRKTEKACKHVFVVCVLAVLLCLRQKDIIKQIIYKCIEIGVFYYHGLKIKSGKTKCI